ncbi:MAG: glycosyl hydrolase 53 family protein [Frankia sp.]|nr:glycosyl hydrolase 53 family protein [Frankia sp.]
MFVRAGLLLVGLVACVLAAVVISGRGNAGTGGPAGGDGPAGGTAARPDGGSPSPRIRGADISFTLQEEAVGNQVSENGQIRPIERILSRHGANWVRLRILVDPPEGYGSDLSSALELARRAHAAGLRVLLNLHYSDVWADPRNQAIPKDWEKRDLDTLARQVHDYTRDVVRAFAQQGTPADMVALGNEVSRGFLWPLGRLGPDRPDGGWPGFLRLMRAAADGARAGNPPGHRLELAVHTDRLAPGDPHRREMFDRLTANLPFDVIALSYYPFWHGPLANLRASLAELATRYGKDLLIAETGYPYQLPAGEQASDDHDPTGAVDLARLPDARQFPPTPEGQVDYFHALRRLISEVPGGHGRGFFAWEPGWLPGVGAWPGGPALLADAAMFDHSGRMLPAVTTAFA